MDDRIDRSDRVDEALEEAAGAASSDRTLPVHQQLRVPVNPQHFRAFLAVVDTNGRIGDAAREVGLSQPGLTHQLNELEKRMNVRLLDRARGRAARLTREGRTFERYARAITQLQASMHEDIDRLSRSVGGVLRVGASPGPGEHWLPPLLCEFAAEFPDLQVELHVGDARTIVEQVHDEEMELGFVGGRWTRAGMQFDPIWRDDFVLVAGAGHPLTQKERLSLRDLEDADFVAQEPGTGLRVAFEQELEDRGLGVGHFNVIAELGNQESVKAAVGAGHGIGCVWKSSVAVELELGRLEVLDIDAFSPDSSFYVVRRSSRRLSRPSQALLEHLQRARDEREARLRRERVESRLLSVADPWREAPGSDDEAE